MLRYNRWRSGWRLVNPLYQETECPQCGALVSGKAAQIMHWNDHLKRREFERSITEAIMQICEKIGLSYGFESDEKRETDEENEPAEGDGYVIGSLR